MVYRCNSYKYITSMGLGDRSAPVKKISFHYYQPSLSLSNIPAGSGSICLVLVVRSRPAWALPLAPEPEVVEHDNYIECHPEFSITDFPLDTADHRNAHCSAAPQHLRARARMEQLLQHVPAQDPQDLRSDVVIRGNRHGIIADNGVLSKTSTFLAAPRSPSRMRLLMINQQTTCRLGRTRNLFIYSKQGEVGP